MKIWQLQINRIILSFVMFLKFRIAIIFLIQKHLKALQKKLKSFGTRQNNLPLLLYFSVFIIFGSEAGRQPKDMFPTISPEHP